MSELSPKPDVAPSIRRVSGTGAAAPVPGRMLFQADSAAEPTSPSLPAVSTNRSSEPALGVPSCRPLSPARFHINFTASEALKNNLDKARELAGRGATVESLFEQAMELLVGKLEQKKLGVAGRKSRDTQNPNGRYVPKAVKRTVHERDGGQCTFVSNDGHRCSERSDLHFDHIVPRALAGEATPKSLRLRCGSHNQLHAEQCFGPLFMADKRQSESGGGSSSEAHSST